MEPSSESNELYRRLSRKEGRRQGKGAGRYGDRDGCGLSRKRGRSGAGLRAVRAGQTEKAVACLEKALACLKVAKPEREKPSGEEETLRILYEKQCEQAGYRFPMREEEAACLPAYARERVLRVLIDLCARQKDGARVRSLAASLAGKSFANLEKALRETAKKER